MTVEHIDSSLPLSQLAGQFNLMADAINDGQLIDTDMEHAAIRYAHPDGDNNNDGATWGTAKADVVSAYDALPAAGGTIFASDGVFWDSVNTDRGLWLVSGASDPVWNGGSPTGGWRVRKRLRLIGATATGHIGNGRAPTTTIFGGSSTDRLKPAIWISGGSAPIEFINIHTKFHAVGWRLGVMSDLSDIHQTSSVTFRNCGAELHQIAGNGPGIELGYIFWLQMFDNCTFAANDAAYTVEAGTRSGTTATFTTTINHAFEAGDTVNVTDCIPDEYNGHWTITSTPAADQFVVTLDEEPSGSISVAGDIEPVKHYRRAAIAHDADLFGVNNVGSGLIVIENAVFNQGGFYYKPNGATSWGDIVMRNITHEGDFDGPEPPTLLIAVRTYGDSAVANAGSDIFVQNVELADASFSSAVEVEGIASPNYLVTAIGASLTGAGTVVGVAPTGRRQAALYNGVWQGSSKASHRVHGVAPVLFTNLAPQDVSTWGSKAGSATVTTGKAAPDGTTNAAELSNASNAEREIYRAGVTPAVGDWVIAGVWRRFVSGTAGTNDVPIVAFSNTDCDFEGGNNYFVLNGPSLSNDGGWDWACGGGKVAAVPGGSMDLVMSLRVGAGNVTAYYAPVLFRVPAASVLDEAELHEIIRTLRPWPDTSPVGSISTLRGQKLIAHGGLGVGNDAAGSSLGSVVKKVQIFDETGASLGYLPVYDAIT